MKISLRVGNALDPRTAIERLAGEVATGWKQEHRPTGDHKFALTPIPYAATTFTGSGSMTWTVTEAQVAKLYWRQIDTIVTLWVEIDTNSVAGGVASSQLRIALPLEITPAAPSYGVGHGVDGGVGISIVGLVQVFQESPQLRIFRTDLGNWTLGAVAVRLTMEYEVQP